MIGRAVVAGLVVLALTGCDPVDRTPPYASFTVTVADGRHIPCVSVYRGGLSCDWAAK